MAKPIIVLHCRAASITRATAGVDAGAAERARAHERPGDAQQAARREGARPNTQVTAPYC